MNREEIVLVVLAIIAIIEYGIFWGFIIFAPDEPFDMDFW